MKYNEKSQILSKKILRICLITTLCLALGIGAIGFVTYRSSMMKKYQEKLTSILDFARTNISTEAMEKWVSAYETDEEFFKTQEMLTSLRDTHDVKYIYILKPVNTEENNNFNYIMIAETEEEQLNDPLIKNSPTGSMLGAPSMDDFKAETAQFCLDYMNEKHDDILFLKADSELYGLLYTGMIPVTDSEGKNIAIMCADIQIQEMVTTFGQYILAVLIGTAIIQAIMIVLFFIWMKRKVIGPIKKMQKSASEFINNSHTDATPDNLHFENPDIHTDDELQMLSEALCKMSDDIKKYMTDMLLQAKESERISSELGVATKIQADMLPRIFPAFPKYKQFELYASMDPAKEVGGDFYDFFFVDETHMALVIADVSGKGIPAALFMVIAKTLIKNRAQLGGAPSEIFESVNNQLCEGNKSKMFVTAWMAIIDIHTGKGIAVNAGHEHPAIRRKNGEFELIKYKHSPALGIISGIPFREHEFELGVGDTLLVYTDGVPEAINLNEQQFTTDRMLKSLNEATSEKPEDLLKSLKSDIDSFVGEAEQFDDVTMLGFKFMGDSDKYEESEN